ncbi:hypothetical protein GCM10009801_79130 [Streptomyces albiaxialis]|uniref:Oxygen sensor histidine kinase NreB n=1 Tax=Streptomyces albiaxialis TaxID=329523 RepID=A0ABN2X551_9ACTN
MNHLSLAPVLRILTWCLHLLVAGLLALSAGRAVVDGGPRPSAVITASVVMAAVYAAGPLLRIAGRALPATVAWLACLGAAWLTLLALTPDSVWLAFPLYFLALHLLPRRAGLATVVVTALVAVAAYALHHQGFTLAALIGPLLGAAVAVATARGFQALYEESEERRQLIQQLTTARADLEVAGRTAGMMAERERLAREIHDTLAQGLSSIQLLLAAAERALATPSGTEQPGADQPDTPTSADPTRRPGTSPRPGTSTSTSTSTELDTSSGPAPTSGEQATDQADPGPAAPAPAPTAPFATTRASATATPSTPTRATPATSPTPSSSTTATTKPPATATASARAITTAARYVAQARRAAQDNLAEARRFVHALVPPDLEGEGASLHAAVERLCDTTTVRHGLPVRFHLSGTPSPLPSPYEVAILRVAQSALANAVAHSEASTVEVTLSYMDDQLALDVVDDGVGFVPDAIPGAEPGRGGFGLAAMRARARGLGGTLSVESAPGHGTAVAVQLPASYAESVAFPASLGYRP